MRSATAMMGLTSTVEQMASSLTLPTSCQNEGQAYPHPRTSVRRRRSPSISLCKPPTETRRPIPPRLQRARANYQPKEDKGYGPRFRCAPSHHHQWATPGGGTDLHLSQIYGLQFYESRLGTEQQDMQGNGKKVAKLNNRVENNSKLTENTKLRVYQDCVLSSLLYGSETWTSYRRQEKRLNCFHPRCLRPILHIHRQDRITTSKVLERAGIPSIFVLLSWATFNARAMGRIPKDLLCGELAKVPRRVGRPRLRYKDICKRDMKLSGIDVNKWESYASDQFASFCAIEAAYCDIEATVVFLLPLFLFVCEQRVLCLDDNVSFVLGDMVEISGEVKCFVQEFLADRRVNLYDIEA